jgi:PhnB protein
MSAISLDPYLYFTGNCREAMEFYHEIFSGDLYVQTLGEVPGMQPEAGTENNVMHARLSGGDITLMASDGTRTEPYPPSNVSLSLGGSDQEKLESIFAKLHEGATAITELKKEFWGDTFGQLTDKFGIDWMINITSAEKAPTA